MALYGTSLVLKETKTQHQCLLIEILTHLLEMILILERVISVFLFLYYLQALSFTG